jgi:hypothetical protein
LIAVLCAGCASNPRGGEARGGPSAAPLSVPSAAAASAAPRHGSHGPIAIATAIGLATVLATASPVPATPAGPAIYAASASPTVAHAGDVVAWEVRTSTEVSSVTAGVRGFTVSLERRSPGRFGTAFRIPTDVPGLFHGEYHVVVTATDPDGSKAHTSLTMRFE